MPSSLDRRLIRESRAARAHLIRAAELGVLEAGLIVAQAVLLATVIARVAVQLAGLAAVTPDLIALGGVLIGRALCGAGFELSGRLGATRVMSELRRRLVAHLLLDAPGERPHNARTGELAASAVQGVDALEAYFAGYLPQLMLASVVPLVVLVWAASIDPIAAGLLAITVPILIAFMILIGKGAAAQTGRRIGVLSLLSAHFLDVVLGLPTLRAYRREAAQDGILSGVGERYRQETMATLRIAFLSALVLELCAMIGTALAAATIGVQLVGGELTLRAGLTVLLLAPELYRPLREVGQQFHASADGVAASERIFAALAEPRLITLTARAQPAPDPAVQPVALRGVCFEYPGRAGPVLAGVDFDLQPGEITALVGESGSGKSTIASLLLRFTEASEGVASCGGIDLRLLDIVDWRSQIAWLPQHPTLFAGSVADNIRLGTARATDEDIRAAALAAGAQAMIAALPNGLATLIGDGGRRLSAGQGQQIALARAFLRNAPLLILDEPTAHLDTDTAEAIGDTIARLAGGRTTLMIVHHPALAQRADHIVRIHAGRILAPTEMLDLAG